MTPFPADHEPRLRAADGWLGLGDWESANAELEELPAVLRAHPRVLVLRTRVYAGAGKWEVAEEIGLRVANTDAADAELFLALARCACALGRAADARTRLALAFELDDSREFKFRVLDDRPLAAAWTAPDK